jgi:hypothetical protein
MNLTRTSLLLSASGALGIAVLALGVAAEARTRPSSGTATRPSCPENVLAAASGFARVDDVVRAAQQRLARQTINSLGTIYHLTPRNAPINFVAYLGDVALPDDQRVPGLLALYRAAAAACGERTASASWAIRWEIPRSVVAGTGGYAFFVKTRNGWRFWGNWCGAGRSASWRLLHCS